MNSSASPRAIALGYFDGVHLGHQALMERATQRAKELGVTSAVFTFDQHPDTVLRGQTVPLITANPYRRDEIRQIGQVDEVIFARFDETMRTMDWRTFISDVLVGQFGAVWIVTGQNNRFGYRGQGTAGGMAEECRRLGIGYDCIEDVQIDGITVSSTYIRACIAGGEMERAHRFLGHPYTITGVVTHGRGQGRGFGVPTINLKLPEEMAMPPYGVYITRVRVDGASYLAATNIGVCPTFGINAPTIEPHLLDFSGNLYGKLVHVELYHFLRPELVFDTVEALKAQIDQDIQDTRAYFA